MNINHENEIWKDVYFIENGIEWDFRGLYQVSSKGGRIKSLGNDKKRKERILKAKKDKNGYEYVCLSKNNKQKNFKVHRLVAHVFLSDSYFENAQVNHKDENKTNNHVENLEWCTSKYNSNYGTRNERTSKKQSESMKGEKNPMYGKHHSEEAKAKMSEARKGKKSPMYGKHHTEETRQKQSEIKKGKYKGEKSPNHRKVVSVDPLTKRIVFTWQYKQQATKFYNIHHTTLDWYLKGKAKKGHLYNDFLFYYADEYEQMKESLI